MDVRLRSVRSGQACDRGSEPIHFPSPLNVITRDGFDPNKRSIPIAEFIG